MKSPYDDMFAHSIVVYNVKILVFVRISEIRDDASSVFSGQSSHLDWLRNALSAPAACRSCIATLHCTNIMLSSRSWWSSFSCYKDDSRCMKQTIAANKQIEEDSQPFMAAHERAMISHLWMLAKISSKHGGHRVAGIAHLQLLIVKHSKAWLRATADSSAHIIH